MKNKTARVICVTNQKGGVGKSTTAQALSEGLTIIGRRVLLIDLDPQGSVTLSTGAITDQPTTYELMMKETCAQAATQHATHEDTQDVMPRPDIIPASDQLIKLTTDLTDTGKEYRLKEQLEPVLQHYDFIIIDTPPALGILTINALTAADSLIIPIQADVYSMKGIGQLYETIKAVRAYTNPGLNLAGVLLTRHTPRSILSRDMTDTAIEAAEHLGTFLYNAKIREAVAIREAQAVKLPIYAYAPKSNAVLDYSAFIEEFLERSENA